LFLQYACDCCASKQDATRWVRLAELPEVLCIQLLRFVFDAEKMDKRKLKDYIEIPDSLTVNNVQSLRVLFASPEDKI